MKADPDCDWSISKADAHIVSSGRKQKDKINNGFELFQLLAAQHPLDVPISRIREEIVMILIRYVQNPIRQATARPKQAKPGSPLWVQLIHKDEPFTSAGELEYVLAQIFAGVPLPPGTTIKNMPKPPPRGRRPKKKQVTEEEALRTAFAERWQGYVSRYRSEGLREARSQMILALLEEDGVAVSTYFDQSLPEWAARIDRPHVLTYDEWLDLGHELKQIYGKFHEGYLDQLVYSSYLPTGQALEYLPEFENYWPQITSLV